MKCETCLVEGRQSRVNLTGSTPLMPMGGSEDFWDEDGNYHSHDYDMGGNPTFKCSNGHEWQGERKRTCSACEDRNSEERTESRGNTATINLLRASLFDILDAGSECATPDCPHGHLWIFNPQDESDLETQNRTNFVDRVIDRIQDLQSK